MSERSQIVVRLPDVETGQLEELCRYHNMTRSEMVRSLIRLAHAKVPGHSQREELRAPSKLAKQLEKRAETRIRNRRSGLQRVEPPACERHEWDTAIGLKTCSVCGARKV